MSAIRRWGVRTALGALIFALAALGSGWVPASAGDCSDILKHGIWETSEGMSEDSEFRSIVRWLYESDFTSLAEARSAGLSIGLPVEGVLVDLGISSSSQSWESTKRELARFLQDTSRKRSTRTIKTRTISKEAIAAWEKCMSEANGSTCVFARLLPQEDWETRRLELRYNFRNPRFPSRIKVKVSCEPKGRVEINGSNETEFEFNGTRSLVLVRKSDEPAEVVVEVLTDSVPFVQCGSLHLARRPRKEAARPKVLHSVYDVLIEGMSKTQVLFDGKVRISVEDSDKDAQGRIMADFKIVTPAGKVGDNDVTDSGRIYQGSFRVFPYDEHYDLVVTASRIAWRRANEAESVKLDVEVRLKTPGPISPVDED